MIWGKDAALQRKERGRPQQIAATRALLHHCCISAAFLIAVQPGERLVEHTATIAHGGLRASAYGRRLALAWSDSFLLDDSGSQRR